MKVEGGYKVKDKKVLYVNDRELHYDGCKFNDGDYVLVLPSFEVLGHEHSNYRDITQTVHYKRPSSLL